MLLSRVRPIANSYPELAELLHLQSHTTDHVAKKYCDVGTLPVPNVMTKAPITYSKHTPSYFFIFTCCKYYFCMLQILFLHVANIIFYMLQILFLHVANIIFACCKYYFCMLQILFLHVANIIFACCKYYFCMLQILFLHVANIIFSCCLYMYICMYCCRKMVLSFLCTSNHIPFEEY